MNGRPMRRIRHEAEIRDRERIGQGRIAHPDHRRLCLSTSDRTALRCPGPRLCRADKRHKHGTIEGQPV